ncbi:MAG TPA: septum formation initiator family protein [Blastocatellia bacterium]
MTGKVWELGAQVEKLERSVNQLKTDARVIESFARQKFGFVKSGDVVIKLPEEQEAASRDVEARRRQLQSRAVVTKKGPNSVNL